jgi:DNA replication initiation complex subunit (GINS family)
MTKVKLPELHPQYLTDERGKSKAVQLPISEYQKLTQFLEDLEDIVDLENAKAKPEETVEITDFWAKIERMEHSRLAQECSKLDPRFEQAMAEEGLICSEVCG